MPSVPELLRQHIDYTIWATHRLLAVSQDLTNEERAHDFGTADKSIAGTLTHLLRAERSWLGRIEHGTPITPWALPEDEDWQHLLNAWPTVHIGWRAWALHLNDDRAAEHLTYTDLKGKTWTNSIVDIVLHVVNHSTHHRGQVSGFLRALGKAPPSVDFIAFIRGGGK